MFFFRRELPLLTVDSSPRGSEHETSYTVLHAVLQQAQRPFGVDPQVQNRLRYRTAHVYLRGLMAHRLGREVLESLLTVTDVLFVENGAVRDALSPAAREVVHDRYPVSLREEKVSYM